MSNIDSEVIPIHIRGLPVDHGGPPAISRQGARGSLLMCIWQWALIFFVPAISIAYLIFCYVVHYRVVPANVSGLSADSTTQFLSKQHLTPIASSLTNVDFPVTSQPWSWDN